MLDRAKVMKALEQVKHSLFKDNSDIYNYARALWRQACQDSLLSYKIAQARSEQFPAPAWQGAIDLAVPIENYADNYCIVAVDGSQIYPDRHQGPQCYLINIGSVQICYTQQPKVVFANEPYIFAESDFDLNVELVNCQRQEYELEATIEIARAHNQHDPLIVLCDGSLIFWHLHAQDPALKKFFLMRYIAMHQKLYEMNTLYVGYISLPKSKEIVNVLHLIMHNFKPTADAQKTGLESVCDSTIMQFYLKPGMRSTIFESNVSITQEYPEHLKPHFFYIDIEDEIVRIEIPAWIALNQAHIQLLSSIIVNQVQKGLGYPVVLAEAHEQAVVKGPDREFFYQLLQKCSMEEHKQFSMSQKSFKKRHMNI